MISCTARGSHAVRQGKPRDGQTVGWASSREVFVRFNSPRGLVRCIGGRQTALCFFEIQFLKPIRYELKVERRRTVLKKTGGHLTSHHLVREQDQTGWGKATGRAEEGHEERTLLREARTHHPPFDSSAGPLREGDGGVADDPPAPGTHHLQEQTMKT